MKGSQNSPLLVSQYGLLLTFHHLLNNLRAGPLWTSSPDMVVGLGSELQASRPISEGEELFLKFDDHPASAASDAFTTLPVQADFDLAQEIIKDEVKYLRPFGGRSRQLTPDGKFAVNHVRPRLDSSHFDFRS